MEARLYISFCRLAGDFVGVFSRVEVEEWKGGVVSHEQAQGGVKVGPIPLARYGPATELHAERDRETEMMVNHYKLSCYVSGRIHCIFVSSPL